MKRKWAFIFPGQGAQYVGMAKDFYDEFPIARQTFEEADAFLKTSFSTLIFEGPASELMLTKNSQVAIYIASVAIFRVMQQLYPEIQPTVCAGLSLGEYTALTASGKIAFTDCLQLVRSRALLMHEACERRKGGMHVILGLDADVVEDVISRMGPEADVWVANLNCPGQVVIAGTQEGMSAAIEQLKSKGAKRALALDVSGAFHSGLMVPAQDKLAPEISKVALNESSIELVMNVPGGYVSDLSNVRQYLLDQVASPVRWEKGIRAMMEQGIEGYIEMGPGKTLAGMNKRIGVAPPTLSIEKRSDLDDLLKLMETQCIC